MTLFTYPAYSLSENKPYIPTSEIRLNTGIYDRQFVTALTFLFCRYRNLKIFM